MISCQRIDEVFASQLRHIDEWQQELLLVDGVEHDYSFHADHAELLVLVV